ncbi:MAG: IPT/TIG domain-containing protein [Acidobacteriota bacterium]
MKIFDAKSPNERNKIIAALVLGVLALGSLAFAFGPGLFSSSSSSATVKVSPTPKASVAPNSTAAERKMPTQGEQDFEYVTTAVVYNPQMHSAPDAGRNIFAFYEPPPPTPYSPTPIPIVTPKPPTPTPTPPMMVDAYNPRSIYAGSRGFRLEITGQRFASDAKVYFSQIELPTTVISPERIVADVPTNLIGIAGSRQIIIQTPDGMNYSNQVMMDVQPPPKPEFQYIGMIARKRFNNDTAYFLESGQQIPTGKRLNDIMGGRFRLVSISAEETIFEDVSLGFRHPVKLYRPAPGTPASGGPPARGGIPAGGQNYVPFNPGNFGQPGQPVQSIPGIPDNIPRRQPTNTNTNTRQQQPPKDDDDDDDGDNPGAASNTKIRID